MEVILLSHGRDWMLFGTLGVNASGGVEVFTEAKGLVLYANTGLNIETFGLKVVAPYRFGCNEG